MIKKFIYLFLFLSFSISGQQTINKLITKELTVQDKVEVTSTTKSSKPCPVMTEVQRDAISSPATGSCVYNSDSLQLNVYDGTTWQEAGGGGISLWETGLSYDVNDVVIESDRIYRCLIAHTSGTFSTDLANGNWTEVSGSIPVSLQDAYEDSSQPQITTNTSGLGVQFKRGTLSDTDVVIEVLNGAAASKFSVTGEGSVSAGSTITATGNITGANLSGTNTGDLTTGGDGDTPATTATIVAPNKQFTLTGTNQYRLNTGNANELQNSNFEHSTVTTGWTVSNATASGNTANPLEGKKSLSLALTGALSLSQSSTINAAQKSGVQMVASIWVNSSDVSDLQLCSLKNGSEDKCTVTGGYVQGSGWRQLTVSFLGDSTSNGLKLKSTDTTGTVLVDQAFVGIGSPIVDFTPDMVYSAQVSSSGVVSGENTDWINGNCSVSGNRISCNYISGLVTVPMNCVATPMTAGIANDTILGYSTGNTSSGFAFDGGTGARQFSVVCQKQGADYKTSKAYVASGSLALNTTEYSAKISNLGVVDRENTDFINGNCTNANPRVCTFVSGRFTVAPNCVVTAVGGNGFIASFSAEASTTQVEIQTSLDNGAATQYTTYLFCQKQGADYQAAFNPVIVGSFQGYNETPGTSRVETFSVVFGTTNKDTPCTASPCSYISQIGNAVTNITRSGTGLYNLNLSKTYSKANCTIDARCASVSGGTVACIRPGSILSCENCNSVQFAGANTGITLNEDIAGTILCQGIPQ